MQRLCPVCEKRYDEDVIKCPDDGEYTIEVPEDLATKLVGTTLDGRWLIEETLGEGGMGAVFRGRQENLDRPVAIKVLRAEVSGSDKIVARFMREARVLSRLNNPHVVTIFDFGRDSETGLLYLVMELLDGKPLGKWWSEDADQTIDQALMIIEQIAKGLDEAHAQDIIHRDLKPDNIFVSPVAGGVHVKVLDFGIAKVHDDNQAITHTGDIHGTPYYMAPEQIDGKNILPATDFYAIGCILYEMFTGKPPFIADSVMAILMHHCARPLDSLASRWGLHEPLTEELVGFVEKLLEKEPEDRLEDTRALLTAIQTLRDPNQTATPVETSPEAAAALGSTASIDLEVDIDEGVAPGALQETLDGPAPLAPGAAISRPSIAPTGNTEDADAGAEKSPAVIATESLADAELPTHDAEEPPPIEPFDEFPKRSKLPAVFAGLAAVAVIGFALFAIIDRDPPSTTPSSTDEPARTVAAETTPLEKELPRETSNAAPKEVAAPPVETTTVATSPKETTPPDERPEETTPSPKTTPPPPKKEAEKAVAKASKKKPDDAARKTETEPSDPPPKDPAQKPAEDPPEEKKPEEVKPPEKKIEADVKVKVKPLKNDLSSELERLGKGR